jgi:hypothetical protein
MLVYGKAVIINGALVVSLLPDICNIGSKPTLEIVGVILYVVRLLSGTVLFVVALQGLDLFSSQIFEYNKPQLVHLQPQRLFV